MSELLRLIRLAARFHFQFSTDFCRTKSTTQQDANHSQLPCPNICLAVSMCSLLLLPLPLSLFLPFININTYIHNLLLYCTYRAKVVDKFSQQLVCFMRLHLPHWEWGKQRQRQLPHSDSSMKLQFPSGLHTHTHTHTCAFRMGRTLILFSIWTLFHYCYYYYCYCCCCCGLWRHRVGAHSLNTYLYQYINKWLCMSVHVCTCLCMHVMRT